MLTFYLLENLPFTLHVYTYTPPSTSPCPSRGTWLQWPTSLNSDNSSFTPSPHCWHGNSSPTLPNSVVCNSQSSVDPSEIVDLLIPPVFSVSAYPFRANNYINIFWDEFVVAFSHSGDLSFGDTGVVDSSPLTCLMQSRTHISHMQ